MIEIKAIEEPDVKVKAKPVFANEPDLEVTAQPQSVLPNDPDIEVTTQQEIPNPPFNPFGSDDVTWEVMTDGTTCNISGCNKPAYHLCDCKQAESCISETCGQGMCVEHTVIFV